MASPSGLRAELETELLTEISRPRSTRDSIAAAYRHALMGSFAGAFVDWPTVNAAILARYTPSGLNYIKRLAWAGCVVMG